MSQQFFSIGRETPAPLHDRCADVFSEKPIIVSHRIPREKHSQSSCFLLWFLVLGMATTKGAKHCTLKQRESVELENQRDAAVMGCSAYYRRATPVFASIISLQRSIVWINIGFVLAPVMAPFAGGRAFK